MIFCRFFRDLKIRTTRPSRSKRSSLAFGSSMLAAASITLPMLISTIPEGVGGQWWMGVCVRVGVRVGRRNVFVI